MCSATRAAVSRSIRSLALLASFQVAPAFLLDPPAFAEQSFPMVCRGGGGMRVEILGNGTMRVFFAPAAQGANTAPPGSGQCTFLDRGIAARGTDCFAHELWSGGYLGQYDCFRRCLRRQCV